MSDTRGRTLRVAISADLGFVLEGWPAPALAVADSFLRVGLEPPGNRGGDDAFPVIRWRVEANGSCIDGDPELSAPWEWRPRGQLSSLAAKLRVWVDSRGGVAVVAANGALSEAETLETVWRLFPAVMGELAAFRGWLLVHAAAVGWGAQAMVLPGEGGCGKTTVSKAAAAAGWPVLSDDLTWIRPAKGVAGAGRVVGFPRSCVVAGLPRPTVHELPLGLLVFPALAHDGRRQVRRLPATDVLRRLNECCVVLGCPATRAARFQAVSQVAARTPGFFWQRPRFVPQPEVTISS